MSKRPNTPSDGSQKQWIPDHQLRYTHSTRNLSREPQPVHHQTNHQNDRTPNQTYQRLTFRKQDVWQVHHISTTRLVAVPKDTNTHSHNLIKAERGTRPVGRQCPQVSMPQRRQRGHGGYHSCQESAETAGSKTLKNIRVFFSARMFCQRKTIY